MGYWFSLADSVVTIPSQLHENNPTKSHYKKTTQPLTQDSHLDQVNLSLDYFKLKPIIDNNL